MVGRYFEDKNHKFLHHTGDLNMPVYGEYSQQPQQQFRFTQRIMLERAQDGITSIAQKLIDSESSSAFTGASYSGERSSPIQYHHTDNSTHIGCGNVIGNSRTEYYGDGRYTIKKGDDKAARVAAGMASFGAAAVLLYVGGRLFSTHSALKTLQKDADRLYNGGDIQYTDVRGHNLDPRRLDTHNVFQLTQNVKRRVDEAVSKALNNLILTGTAVSGCALIIIGAIAAANALMVGGGVVIGLTACVALARLGMQHGSSTERKEELEEIKRLMNAVRIDMLPSQSERVA
jgi:hypothetical protein